MTYEEKIMKLSIGKVVEWHRQKYPNPILYVHVVGFEHRSGWSLGTGVVIDNYGRRDVIPLEEIEI